MHYLLIPYKSKHTHLYWEIICHQIHYIHPIWPWKQKNKIFLFYLYREFERTLHYQKISYLKLVINWNSTFDIESIRNSSICIYIGFYSFLLLSICSNQNSFVTILFLQLETLYYFHAVLAHLKEAMLMKIHWLSPQL